MHRHRGGSEFSGVLAWTLASPVLPTHKAVEGLKHYCISHGPFQHLHWIAVWDGVIWGWVWLQTRNLYIPIAAHSMEVMIEYLIIREVLA
jgi:hypothetical protein